MAHALRDILKSLPPKQRTAVNKRYEDLVNEVESLKELRKISEVSQARLAELLEISQPAVSKIERQTDMYLSTLRSYVEAVGGELDVIIRLPRHGPVKIKSLEDVSST